MLVRSTFNRIPYLVHDGGGASAVRACYSWYENLVPQKSGLYTALETCCDFAGDSGRQRPTARITFREIRAKRQQSHRVSCSSFSRWSAVGQPCVYFAVANFTIEYQTSPYYATKFRDTANDRSWQSMKHTTTPDCFKENTLQGPIEALETRSGTIVLCVADIVLRINSPRPLLSLQRLNRRDITSLIWSVTGIRVLRARQPNQASISHPTCRRSTHHQLSTTQNHPAQ